jgi:uncharacterized membrane protein YqhA
MKQKKKMNTTRKLLIVAVCAIMSYTIAAFILQFFTITEISPTLTTAYYAFWTCEIFALAGIRIKKLKNETKNEEDI